MVGATQFLRAGISVEWEDAPNRLQAARSLLYDNMTTPSWLSYLDRGRHRIRHNENKQNCFSWNKALEFVNAAVFFATLAAQVTKGNTK